MEIDIFIPEINVGIEYDGKAWHNDTSFDREVKKYKICRDNKIKLIRVKENRGSKDLSTCDEVVYTNYKPNYMELNETILHIMDLMNSSIEIDVLRDDSKIKELYYSNLRNNSLAAINPKLASEWDYEKNGMLIPEMVRFGSESYYWWNCDKGHSYKARINNRIHGTGCPYCSNKKVLAGYNDLQTTNPELAKEWDYEKNALLTPEMITAGSNKKVWWKCNKGHSWDAVVYSRKKSGCPYCANKLKSIFDKRLIK